MTPHETSNWRSACPLNIALELLGDRWSLLVLRDLMLKGMTTFKQFQEAGEGIATNVLTDRLRTLQERDIISSQRSSDDRRVVSYFPTKKGLDLLPVMIELILWAAKYELTAAPSKILNRLKKDREGFIAEIRRRFEN